jgi:lycopene cyclase CruP
MTVTEQILSQIPGNPLTGLRQTDALWQAYRTGANSASAIPTVVEVLPTACDAVEWDVAICGGTLGILIGAAIAQQGWKVALIERGQLRGRDQEWNISRHELQEMIEIGILTAAELERAIATEFNPVGIRFHQGTELWVNDVLNVGVDPVYLLETLKQKFLAAGGCLWEQTEFKRAIVQSNGVKLELQQGESEISLTSRLLLDATGHFSPISRQARNGQKPDAICLVVGTCATGFPENQTGDLMASITPITRQCQYFWEAFPAQAGRTTYLFTYLDAAAARPSLADLFEDYFRLLPEYQTVELDQLQFQRSLFGFFPCYRNSPLKAHWDRILPIGDSAGGQSPLSFGGFGAMIRHLRRLSQGIDEALTVDALQRSDLSLLQPYQPNIAVTWLFQRSMSVGINQTLAPQQINGLLSAVFQEMEGLGDRTLRPFLQDVIQFSGLFKTLATVSVTHPLLVVKIIPQVGLIALLTWLFHFVNLAIYTALQSINSHLRPLIPLLSPRQQYRLHRWFDAWKYGSGGDYSNPKQQP